MQEKLRKIPYYGSLGLLAYMPFHIFLAQSLSLLTGGLDVWKVAKDFITILLLALAVVLALYNRKIRDDKIFKFTLLIGIIYGLLHLSTYYFDSQTTLSVALLASVYNNRLIWYFLIAFVGVRLVKDKNINFRILRLVLIVSTLVCLFGLAQWFLPKDILTHLGYSIERGVRPIFYINDDPNFPRLMSTVRDPNSLGAFLLVPILLLASLVNSVKKDKRKLVVGLLALHVLILFLTFSRAAWGGAVVAGFTLIAINNKQKLMLLIKKFWPLLILAVIVLSIGLYSQKQTHLVRSVVFRIDDRNKSTALKSDQLHYYFVEKGISGIWHKPFGHGPGTAGIVSIQNTNGSFLTENYYIQIAYEVGILGLVLFVGFWVWVTKMLYFKKSLLAQALFATSVAYFVMALLMHFWSNEALAAQWWLLAGAMVGVSAGTKKVKKL